MKLPSSAEREEFYYDLLSEDYYGDYYGYNGDYYGYDDYYFGDYYGYDGYYYGDYYGYDGYYYGNYDGYYYDDAYYGEYGYTGAYGYGDCEGFECVAQTIAEKVSVEIGGNIEALMASENVFDDLEAIINSGIFAYMVAEVGEEYASLEHYGDKIDFIAEGTTHCLLEIVEYYEFDITSEYFSEELPAILAHC